MSRFVVNLLDNPSKQEEIDALRKIAERWPTDSYLASLFTEDFLGWIERQIRADWPPNMMMELQSQTNQKHDLITEVNALSAEVERIGANAQKKIIALEGSIDQAIAEAKADQAFTDGFD